MRKKNVKLWNHLLKELKDFEIQAGWFENTRYDADTPIAGIAATQNYGAEISNPGGQPYYINSSTGLAVFVSKTSLFGQHLIAKGQVTKPHTITIPPRPFMDNAKKRIQGEEGKEILMQELLRVFEGRQTMQQAASRLKEWLKNIIQEEITKLQSPPLKSSTVRNREKRYVSNAKNQDPVTMAKPLVDTGLMLETVQGKFELK